MSEIEATVRERELALTSQQCASFLESIVFHGDRARFGVPAYFCSRELADGDLPIPRGARFHVQDAEGHVETLRIEPSGRQGSRVLLPDLLHAVADQSRLLVAQALHPRIVLRSRRAGSSVAIFLRDDWGAPLASLGMGCTTARGADVVRLVLQGNGRQLADRPFALLASRRPGLSSLLGAELPLADDQLLATTAALALEHHAQGHCSQLDGRAAASLLVPDSLLACTSYRDELYLVVVALAQARRAIESVSNPFTIAFL